MQLLLDFLPQSKSFEQVWEFQLQYPFDDVRKNKFLTCITHTRCNGGSIVTGSIINHIIKNECLKIE